MVVGHQLELKLLYGLWWMRWRASWRRFINATDRAGLVALQEPRGERSFLPMDKESGVGVDAVSCEGTAALSMAARMLAAGRWLLTWWLCAVV